MIALTARWLKRIPGLAPGILFCFSHASVAAPDLAGDLFAEGQWRAARREALRSLVLQPDDESSLLLAAVAALRLDPRDEAARAVVAHLGAEAGTPSLRAWASYEAGRAFWTAGDPAGAWTCYARAFRESKDRELFLHSGCAMFLLRQEDGALGAQDPALLQQLAACRDLWSWELRDTVRPPAPEGVSARPGAWIVAFYRAQIRPAIGHRCVLQPSCSAYFLEASRTRGWLGFPLLGDRLVREPGVVAAAERPVKAGEMILYEDPLEDHLHAPSHD